VKFASLLIGNGTYLVLEGSAETLTNEGEVSANIAANIQNEDSLRGETSNAIENSNQTIQSAQNDDEGVMNKPAPLKRQRTVIIWIDSAQKTL